MSQCLYSSGLTAVMCFEMYLFGAIFTPFTIGGGLVDWRRSKRNHEEKFGSKPIMGGKCCIIVITGKVSKFEMLNTAAIKEILGNAIPFGDVHISVCACGRY